MGLQESGSLPDYLCLTFLSSPIPGTPNISTVPTLQSLGWESSFHVMNLPGKSLLLLSSPFPGSLIEFFSILIIEFWASHECGSPNISVSSPFWVHRAIFWLPVGFMRLTWIGQCVWPFFESARPSKTVFSIWPNNSKFRDDRCSICLNIWATKTYTEPSELTPHTSSAFNTNIKPLRFDVPILLLKYTLIYPDCITSND